MDLRQLQTILNIISKLYEEERFKDAVELAMSHFTGSLKSLSKGEQLFQCNLASLIIDSSEAAKHNLDVSDSDFKYFEKSLEHSVHFFKENLPSIQRVLKRGTANYNYANALSSLLDYKRRTDPSFLNPQNSELINLTRKQFLKASLSSPENYLEVRTNLAHTLCKAHRVVEAIQIYDEVLRQKPDLFNALYSRSLDLEYLWTISSSYSVKMLYEIADGYAKAARAPGIHPSMKLQSLDKYRSTLRTIEKMGSSEDSLAMDLAKKDEDLNAHSPQRQYELVNGLSLSEHGIYCHCNGANRDDLSAIPTSGKIGGKFVARQETILNQLKAEFVLARTNYYRAMTSPPDYYLQTDFQTCLSNFFGNERLDGRSEDLKVAFRLCFGILDRIALGVCELYQLPVASNEKIYFENFWEGRSETPEELARWNKIISITDNPSVHALFFQSTDLNDRKGEWRSFKRWRNALEHGFFVLYEGTSLTSRHDSFESPFLVVSMKYSDFEKRTKDLLQFTRSAIFNYAFAIRAEGERALTDQHHGIEIDVPKK